MFVTYGQGWSTNRKGLPEQELDLDAGRDCLSRVTAADFWEWSGGSRLFFWRWPKEVRQWARDGHPAYLVATPPRYTKPRPIECNPNIQSKVKDKLEKFIKRGYLAKGQVSCLIGYFTVPKGDEDVRVVFDGTKSGLNNVIWAPTFCLPTVESLLPMVEPGTWQGDIDVAEQFYNYLLHPDIRTFCGVDVHPFFNETTSSKRTSRLMWLRCVMGLRSSPHGCVKMQALADELVKTHGSAI